MIKVYIKINDENYITEINSAIFIADTNGWIEIDEGEGDKYAHAQGNYLDKSIIDEQGRYNYKYLDGEVVEVAEEDKPIIEPTIDPPSDTEARLQALEEEFNVLLGGVENGQNSSSRAIQTSITDVCTDINR